jgi:hypothetical protein
VAFGVGSSAELSDISPTPNSRPPSFEDAGAVGVPLDLSDASESVSFGGEVEPSDPGEEAEVRSFAQVCRL